MQIKSFCFNPFQENTYVLYDEVSSEAWVIDPGMSNENEWNRLKISLSEDNLHVSKVLLTHCHVDHLMGTGFIRDAFGSEICGPLGDEGSLPSPKLQSQLFGVPLSTQPASISKNLCEGMELSFGSSKVLIFDCPGHSHHGLCYYLPTEKLLFTGDVLFFRSIGRFDFGASMGGNRQLLIESIVAKLMSLPSDVRVLPGHGPETSIGQEQRNNPYF